MKKIYNAPVIESEKIYCGSLLDQTSVPTGEGGDGDHNEARDMFDFLDDTELDNEN